MRIGPDLENAFVLYLKACADPEQGGFARFMTNMGEGAELEIRPGHSTDGEHPAAGLIICEAIDDAQQQQILGLNAWGAVMEIRLEFPFDETDANPNALATFDSIGRELFASLMHPDALAAVNAMAKGIHIHGPREGIATGSSIEGNCRVANFILSLAVSTIPLRPELL